jgi:mycoredoxin
MLKVYSTSWCPDCTITKTVLKSRGVAFEEINIEEDAAAAELVMRLNGGKRSVPTLVYNDDAASLSRFSRAKLDEFLGRNGLLAGV